jgi:methionyl-tRNA formyltransferase
MKIALFVAGTKGISFLRSFSEHASVELVTSYPSKGLQHDAYSEIQALSETRRYRFRNKQQIRADDYMAAELVFLVGWQWLLTEIDDRFIVLHDSLLPKLRGFSPTVAALISGETELGVTAFKPGRGTDTGPICGQEELSIQYPVTIGEVYDRLGKTYSRLTSQIMRAGEAGSLTFNEQDARAATYSIWRGDDDYYIDWSSPADDIRRFIDAVGWPYLGAKTVMQGREIRIDQAEQAPDLAFAQRHPGKIWTIRDGIPEIVCGSGMLRILRARDAAGGSVSFSSIRVKLR